MKIHSGLTQNPANELLELLELLDKSPESQTTSRSQACQAEQAGTLHLDLVECSSSYLGSTFPAPAHLTRKASENIAVSETDESGHRQGSLKLFRCCTSTLGPTLGSSLAFLERRGRRGEAASRSSRGGVKSRRPTHMVAYSQDSVHEARVNCRPCHALAKCKRVDDVTCH